jgi:hypothetical protein
VALARGALLVLLRAGGSGSALPPPGSCAWLSELLSAFGAWPRLGAASQAGGLYWWPPAALGDAPHAPSPAGGPLFRDDKNRGLPFEFVSAFVEGGARGAAGGAAGGAVALRASALAAVGGMDAMLAPLRGEAACGGGAGSGGEARAAELSLRLWANGWYVARMAPHFTPPPPQQQPTAQAAVDDAACAAHAAAGLDADAAARRYPASFSKEVLRHVISLNDGELARTFDGNAPWEHAWWRGGLGLSSAARARAVAAEAAAAHTPPDAARQVGEEEAQGAAVQGAQLPPAGQEAEQEEAQHTGAPVG